MNKKECLIQHKLKPCPFCGGTAHIYQDYTGMYVAQCDKCGITTLMCGNEKIAKKRWNKRVDGEKGLRAEVDKWIGRCQEWHEIAVQKQKEARQEVAREIFAEIEKEILSAIDNNLQRMAEQDNANEIWRMCVSKKNTLCGIYDFTAELKKKYTEGEDG